MKQTGLLLLLTLIFTGCHNEPQPGNTPVAASAEPIAPAPSVQAHDTTPVLPGAADYARSIRLQAEMMNGYLLKGDFKSFVKFTHPSLIEKFGGEEKMVNMIVKGFQDLKAQGNSITKITLEEPSKVVLKNGELQAVISETLEMKLPSGTMITRSALIAVSKDEGKSWFFIDTGGKDFAMMQRDLPNLSNELVLPKPEKPKLVEESL